MTGRATSAIRAVAPHLLITIMALLLGASACSVGARGVCDMAGWSFELTGTAVDVSGDVVTYRVDTIIDANQHRPRAVDRPVPGDLVEVTYWDGDARFIDEGSRYRVGVWDFESGDGYASGVHQADDVCGGGGTTYADGSAIDTGLFTRNGFELWVAPAVLIPLAMTILLIRSTIDRRHQRRVASRFAARLEASRDSSNGVSGG